MRPFEEQSALERTLRANLYHPQDLLRRSLILLPHHVRRKEYREAAEWQTRVIKAEQEVKNWENLLALYEAEVGELNKALALKLDAMPSGLTAGQCQQLEKAFGELKYVVESARELAPQFLDNEHGHFSKMCEKALSNQWAERIPSVKP